MNRARKRLFTVIDISSGILTAYISGIIRTSVLPSRAVALRQFVYFNLIYYEDIVILNQKR